MLYTTIASLAVHATMIMAAPLQRRAGGPAAMPIPSNCTVVNPLPLSNCPRETYKLSDNFTSANILYRAYYESTQSQADTWKQCIEQCYGYGNPGECKFALLAYQTPEPENYFGAGTGNQTSPTGCLFFTQYAESSDFVLAEPGTYLNETAGNIVCPSS